MYGANASFYHYFLRWSNVLTIIKSFCQVQTEHIVRKRAILEASTGAPFGRCHQQFCLASRSFIRSRGVYGLFRTVPRRRRGQGDRYTAETEIQVETATPGNGNWVIVFMNENLRICFISWLNCFFTNIFFWNRFTVERQERFLTVFN